MRELRLEEQKLVLQNRQQPTDIQEFSPKVIQSCMEPNRARLYPVTARLYEAENMLEILLIGESHRFSLSEYTFTIKPYVPKLPGHKPCGDCQHCGKCC